MTPNVERMRRNEEEEEPARGYPPSVVRVPQKPEQSNAAHDMNAYGNLSSMRGVSPQTVVQNMRAANLGPQLSIPDERLMNGALDREPHFSGVPEGRAGATGLLREGERLDMRSGEPSLMGFLTDGQSWRDIGRNVKDFGVSLAQIPVGTADVLVKGADLFTGGGASEMMRDKLGFRPEETLNMIESYRSEEGKKIKEGFENTEGFFDKGKYLIENPGQILNVLADNAPDALVSTSLGGMGKFGTLGRALVQGAASGITDGAGMLRNYAKVNNGRPPTPEEINNARRVGFSSAVLNTAASPKLEKFHPFTKKVGEMGISSLTGGIQQFYENMLADKKLDQNVGDAMLAGGGKAVFNPFGYEMR